MRYASSDGQFNTALRCDTNIGVEVGIDCTGPGVGGGYLEGLSATGATEFQKVAFRSMSPGTLTYASTATDHRTAESSGLVFRLSYASEPVPAGYKPGIARLGVVSGTTSTSR